MAARHGTANRYNQGCRCDACKESHRLRAADYRQRCVSGEVHVVADLPQPAPSDPGPVELGVAAEIDGLASQARPGLAQAALALARLMDNPRAVNQQPAAAKVLGRTAGKAGAASARPARRVGGRAGR